LNLLTIKIVELQMLVSQPQPWEMYWYLDRKFPNTNKEEVY